MGFCAVLALMSAPAVAKDVDSKAVLENYSNIAKANYEDSYLTAQKLRTAVAALIEKPSDDTLKAARQAWLEARVPYQQTEAFRFGNPVVDEWEGRVNAWPLDEGLIDYVDASYGTDSDTNAFYNLNIIANPNIEVGGQKIDATTINKDVLEQLHEIGGIEANVSIGYHAIEFLLWGQDLNGNAAGAGNRPASDYDTKNCTNGHCDRRGAYLLAATDLLVEDLKEMVDAWDANGEARKNLVDGTPEAGFGAILTGLGSLSYGELAGERMKLGLLLGDPEEEHDCFSDNTHNSHYYNVMGMSNIYHGTYVRVDGTKVEGASLVDVVKAKDAQAAADLDAKLAATLADMGALKKRAETVEAYDQMIGEGNTEGNAVVQKAIDALVAQTRSIERVITALNLNGIALEGSDSLDNPDAVFQ